MVKVGIVKHQVPQILQEFPTYPFNEHHTPKLPIQLHPFQVLKSNND